MEERGPVKSRTLTKQATKVQKGRDYKVDMKEDLFEVMVSHCFQDIKT